MLEKNVKLENKTILVTGAAGFIGANLIQTLLKSVVNVTIVGIDNMNDYYDVSLKEFRLNQIRELVSGGKGKFIFIKGNIAEQKEIRELFETHRPQIVVNLAAQAGVRYSIENPDAYIESNMIGFYNLLEACRHSYDGGAGGVEHFVYASSSSVYGSNKKIPYATEDQVDNPVSLYAATKKSNELMAHAYAKLYGIPSTGLRFFTVYGPAGRPDMAYFGFTDKLVRNETIKIFNYGNCKRDFTYIDDIVEGVSRIVDIIPEGNLDWDEENPDPATSPAPYGIYNIGNQQPTKLMDYISCIETAIGREARKEFLPMQPGDVYQTYADSSALAEATGFKPCTPLQNGIERTVDWFKEYYKL